MQGFCITFYQALFSFYVSSCITHHPRFSHWLAIFILIYKPLSTFPWNIVVSYLVYFPYQEKDLLEKHNLWLDEELKAKVKNLADLRKANMDEESRMSAKIAEVSFFN
jgi:hypothetical protein